MNDYGSKLAPTFVGEGCAAEVVVTGKGSMELYYYRNSPVTLDRDRSYVHSRYSYNGVCILCCSSLGRCLQA